MRGGLRQGDHRVGVWCGHFSDVYVTPHHTLMAQQEANTIGFTHCGSLARSLQYLVSRFLSTSPFSGKKMWFAILF